MSRSSSTDSCSIASTLRDLPPEDDLGRAERDAVDVLELRALEPPPVHLEPVRRVEVDDPVRRALLAQLRVAARDVAVGDLDVALLRAADHDAALVDVDALPVPVEAHLLPLDPELDGRGRLRRLLPRLVDHRVA